MGIICVLMLWTVLLTIVGIPVAVALFAWSWRNQKRSGAKGRALRAGAAATLPMVLLAYGGVAFIAYGIWCEEARQADPGIGDGWQVPVANGYFFCMIDVPEDGYILKGGCTGSPAVSEIIQLAAVGDLVIGDSRSSGPFIFDTNSGKVQKFPDLDTTLSQFPMRPALETANVFYSERRWGLLDLIAFGTIGIPAIGILVLWYRLFIMAAPRRAQNSAEP